MSHLTLSYVIIYHDISHLFGQCDWGKDMCQNYIALACTGDLVAIYFGYQFDIQIWSVFISGLLVTTILIYQQPNHKIMVRDKILVSVHVPFRL